MIVRHLSGFLIAWAILAVLPSASAEQFQLGWIGPLTGKAAILGTDALESVRMVVEKHNQLHPDRTVNLRVEDDGLEVVNTVRLYHALRDTKKVQVFLIYNHGGLLAVGPKSSSEGVAIVDPLDCDNEIAALPENVFCIAKRTEEFASVLAQAGLKHSAKAAVLHWNEDSFQDKLFEVVKQTYAANGTPLVFEGGYTTAQLDFRPLLLRARSRGAEVLFLLSNIESGLIAKQARELKLNADLFGLMTLLSPDSIKYSAGTEEGAHIVSWNAKRSPIYQDFLEQFKQRTGREPILDLSTVPSYDAAKVIIEALESDTGGCSASFAKCVIKRLKDLRDYPGASGTFSMQADGSVIGLTPEMKIIKGGVAVDPEVKGIRHQ